MPDIADNDAKDICRELRLLLADVFTLYLKTKNFHWHMTGVHFRDFHRMLDDQGDQLIAMTDPLAERARKLGGSSLRSIGDVSRHQRLQDQDDASLSPSDMLAELRRDNQRLAASLRSTHGTCDDRNDVATASLIENWIDETEGRVWFLTEILK
jgi:starvation-inducible DNA-binding protein